jgi:hypothetical protein
MPSSKETPTPRKTAAKTAEIAGRNLARGAKEPSAREQRRDTERTATKSTPAAQKERLVRGVPQDPENYAASVWGTQTAFEVTTPSGQKCLVRELTVERLIEMGLLELINSLESIVSNDVLPKVGGEQAPTVDMNQLMKDPSKLMRVLDLVNTIVCEAVVAPKVHQVPADGASRVQGQVYVDSIGMEDRFALFGEVTGNLEGLATFR